MTTTKLPCFSDIRGDLVPLEFKNISFIPQRIFFVKNVPEGTCRGGHAHYNTKQLLICLKGKIKVVLHDGNEEHTSYLIENESILIDRMIWDYQEFSSDQDVLLVLCSTPFNLEDYIVDFEKFKKISSEQRELGPDSHE
jgi:dTDP-4-dehydrorhamnose 3,5-epimerase-like enzyme